MTTTMQEMKPAEASNAQTRARARAVCLRGFALPQQEQAAHILEKYGYRVVRSLEAAQLVVAGPEADKALVDQTQTRGLKLVRWEKLSRRLEAMALPSAAAEPEDKPVHPLVEHAEGMVRVLGVKLPAGPGGKLAPGAERFTHLCLDQPFADTLGAVLLGARSAYPVALEGETAASKTTAVLWLAHLLGQPVARLNLNGQTDAGELVGRYVPAEALGGIGVEELLAHAEWLRPVSRRLLEQARAEGRALTPVEHALLARTERFTAGQWRFQESCLPQAMRHGWWLLLDEMNLAEPQILERLNCALECPPTLVMSEGDGTVFGAGGDVPVHAGFRLFATLNPAEYSGRSVLSPAFRDRWTVWHQAQLAGEPEFRQMLEFLVFGRQPVVSVGGRRYQGAEAAVAPFARWQDLAGVEELLPSLAMFHYSAVKAGGNTGAAGLARHQRERVTFTRRTLLSLAGYVSERLAAGADRGQTKALLRAAIDIFYTGRLRDAGDRKAVGTMLRAAGF